MATVKNKTVKSTSTFNQSSLPEDKTILYDNYLYISHLDEGLRFWRLPTCPDTISDNMQVTFGQQNALGRTAPVFTYSNSGPRTMQIDLKLHRDMMNEINENYSNSPRQGYGEDYVDNLVKAIQAIAVPKYNLNNKAVEPPLVAVRFANQIFIKGIVTSSVGVVYEKPILSDDKYAMVTVSFQVSEVDPYDATTVYKNGSFRGMVRTLRNGMTAGD